MIARHLRCVALWRYTTMLFITVVIACADTGVPVEMNASESPSHRVITDAASVAGLSLDTLAALEADALHRVLTRLPVEVRMEARRILESGPPGAVAMSFVSSTDPEIAAALSELSSIRAARAQTAMGEGEGSGSPHAPDSSPGSAISAAPKVSVQVALVPALKPASARATVLAPSGAGRPPLVLLNADTFVPSDIDMGLRVAARISRAVAAGHRHPSRITLYAHRGAARTPTASELALAEHLRRSPVHDVAGVGRVPLATVLTAK